MMEQVALEELDVSPLRQENNVRAPPIARVESPHRGPEVPLAPPIVSPVALTKAEYSKQLAHVDKVAASNSSSTPPANHVLPDGQPPLASITTANESSHEGKTVALSKVATIDVGPARIGNTHSNALPPAKGESDHEIGMVDTSPDSIAESSKHNQASEKEVQRQQQLRKQKAQAAEQRQQRRQQQQEKRQTKQQQQQQLLLAKQQHQKQFQQAQEQLWLRQRQMIELKALEFSQQRTKEHTEMSVKPELLSGDEPCEGSGVHEAPQDEMEATPARGEQVSGPGDDSGNGGFSEESKRKGRQHRDGSISENEAEHQVRSVTDLNAWPPPDDEGLVERDGEAGDGRSREENSPSPAVSRASSSCSGGDRKRRRVKEEGHDSAYEGDDRRLDPQNVNGAGQKLPGGVSRDEGAKALHTINLSQALASTARRLPRNAHCHFFQGLVLQRAQQPAKAAAAFEKALAILKGVAGEHARPKLAAQVLSHLAQCKLELRLRGACQMENQKAVNMEPENAAVEGQEAPNVAEPPTDELEDVVAQLKEAAMLDSSQPPIWHSLGQVLLRAGRYQSAVTVLTAVLSAMPNHLDSLANLGVAFLHTGQAKQATRCVQGVLAQHPTHAGALATYAVLQMQESCCSGPGLDAAQRCLEAALCQDPHAPHLWANLGAAYSAGSRFEDATCCLDQALLLDASPSVKQAVALQRVRDGQQRQRLSPSLLAAAKDLLPFLTGKAISSSLSASMAWRAAANASKTIASQEPESSGLAEERLLRALQHAVEEDPVSETSVHLMGLQLLGALKLGPAERYLKAAIMRNTSSAAAWSNLGVALQLQQEGEAAENAYRRACHLAVPHMAHCVQSNLGTLYYQQGRFAEAHVAFRQALELAPHYAPALNNLGLLYATECRPEQAAAAFATALDADPSLAAARCNSTHTPGPCSNGVAPHQTSQPGPGVEPFPLPSIS